jgi:PAS domain S-box-containing protein
LQLLKPTAWWFRIKKVTGSLDKITPILTEKTIRATSFLATLKMNVSKIIEEKNKSEGIVNSMSSPLLVTDTDKKIQLMNPKAEEVFGLKESKATGKHYLETMDKDKIFELITLSLETAEKQGANNKEVFEFRDEENNKEFYFRINTTPVQDKKGNINLVVTLLEGITAADAPASILWVETVGMLLGRLEFLVIFFAIVKIFKDIKYLATE